MWLPSHMPSLSHHRLIIQLSINISLKSVHTFSSYNTMEGVYGRIWHLGKGERLRKCKGSSSRIWEEDKCRSETIREIEYGKRKRLCKKEVARKVYDKNVVWVKWWKIWREVSEKVREKLTKMEVSFSREETLKKG